MNFQETAYFSVLLLICLSENALGAGWHKNKWRLLFVVALPAVGWVHAVSWFYNVPMFEIKALLESPALRQSVSLMILVLISVHIIYSLLSVRSTSARVLQIASALEKQPSWSGLFLLYPCAASCYPLFATMGKTVLTWLPAAGIVALGLIFLWILRKLNSIHRIAMRPLLLSIQWILFNHLTQSIS